MPKSIREKRHFTVVRRGTIEPPKLRPKFGINVRHDREMGVARVTRLKGVKRYGPYHYCSSESLDRGTVAFINEWVGRNETSGQSRNRSRLLRAVA